MKIKQITKVLGKNKKIILIAFALPLIISLIAYTYYFSEPWKIDVEIVEIISHRANSQDPTYNYECHTGDFNCIQMGYQGCEKWTDLGTCTFVITHRTTSVLKVNPYCSDLQPFIRGEKVALENWTHKFPLGKYRDKVCVQRATEG